MSSKKMWPVAGKVDAESKRSLSVLKEKDRETLRDGSSTNL